MLIDANARTDFGETALMGSCRRGHEACARMLIDAKARTDLKNKRGETALDFAKSKGLTAICELLER